MAPKSSRFRIGAALPGAGAVRVALALAALGLFVASGFPGSARAASAPVDAQASIINGSVAQPSSWPWIAALLPTSKPTHSFCGGIVVAPTRVLTAGHCVVSRSAAEIVVVVGRKTLSDTAAGETAHVVRVAVDPQYPNPNGPHSLNDVAVLTLAQPVAVPVATLGTESDWGSTVMWTAGWGQTNNVPETDPSRVVSDSLLSVSLQIWDDQQCANAWGSAYAAATNFCAGGDGVHAMCSGDSGGPDMVTPDGGKTWLLIGVNSGAPYLCATAGKPEIFAWVAGPTLRSWIVSAIAEPPPATGPAAPGPASVTISKREAIRDLEFLVRRKTHRNPRLLSTRCRRTSSASFSCEVRFVSRHSVYRGRFEVRDYLEGGVVYWTGSFNGRASTGKRVRWSL